MTSEYSAVARSTLPTTPSCVTTAIPRWILRADVFRDDLGGDFLFLDLFLELEQRSKPLVLNLHLFEVMDGVEQLSVFLDHGRKVAARVHEKDVVLHESRGMVDRERDHALNGRGYKDDRLVE
ncbi:MAG: hypothetical protein HY074_08040 [Deltaproteobacteria bacterium]|nr:hypothetical protein [Deltaproteobacteria bacterium]